ncbi:hypothetical protein HPB49_013833 [Dermacentor silvarum]|uniref:Uncharacterized protein n=1 Tax=Dermacentor silvarum TaxID=543639 RepID=A0ACB8D5Z1_DERSI|nr:hypothetical protein HPB49_013833 [Dermacentor silvarum]
MVNTLTQALDAMQNRFQNMFDELQRTDYRNARPPFSPLGYRTFQTPTIKQKRQIPEGQAALLPRNDCPATQLDLPGLCSKNREIIAAKICPPGEKPFVAVSAYFRPVLQSLQHLNALQACLHCKTSSAKPTPDTISAWKIRRKVVAFWPGMASNMTTHLLLICIYPLGKPRLLLDAFAVLYLGTTFLLANFLPHANSRKRLLTQGPIAPISRAVPQRMLNSWLSWEPLKATHIPPGHLSALIRIRTKPTEIFRPILEDYTASAIQAILLRHKKANSPIEIIWTPGHTGVPGGNTAALRSSKNSERGQRSSSSSPPSSPPPAKKKPSPVPQQLPSAASGGQAGPKGLSIIAMGADVQRVLAGIRSRCIILLHCLRAEGQRIYQTLLAGTSAAAPAVPSAATLANDKSAVTPPDEYDTALATLWHQFTTLSNVIVERHRFHRRSHSTTPAFAKDPAKELARLRRRVWRQQQSSKHYTVKGGAAKKTKIAVGDFVRIKKPSVRFKGDCSFSSPTKVIERRGPASFRLKDGRTWNASNLSRVPGRGTCEPVPCCSLPRRSRGLLAYCSLPRCSLLCYSRLSPRGRRGLLAYCSSSQRASRHRRQCDVQSGRPESAGHRPRSKTIRPTSWRLSCT